MSLNLRQLQKERQKISAAMTALKRELEAVETLMVRAEREAAAAEKPSESQTETGLLPPQSEMKVVTINDPKEAISAVVEEIAGRFTKGDVAARAKVKFPQLNIDEQTVSYRLWHLADKAVLRIVERGRGGKESIYEKAS